MKELNYVSHTLMSTVYGINKKKDYDFYLDNFIKMGKYSSRFFSHLVPYFAFIKTIVNYDIIHLPSSGFLLSNSVLKHWEPFLFKLAGAKTVIIPYGGDFYRYSKIKSPLLIHALLKSYPDAARNEEKIEADVQKWVKNADIFIPAIQLDGIGRWDVLAPSVLCIDTREWNANRKKHVHDGRNGVVKIIHTPNHRGFKGTEFITQAVDQLKDEGLLIELLLIEGRSNDEVRLIMIQEADILAEQLIFTGYGLSGVEGMASGIPVLSNLEDSSYTTLFNLYSFLKECPIFSTDPNSIKNNLRILVSNPTLRAQLGEAGKKYIDKYHSYQSAQYMFSKIYDKIWHGSDVDLINMYDPSNINSYNNSLPFVQHPFIENRL